MDEINLKGKSFFVAAAILQNSEVSFVSVLLTGFRGHVPQDIGARVLIGTHGLLWGTVGGGKVENDARLKPILVTRPPGEAEDQNVAWAVERKDGGRGFGFTGGHYFANWSDENFRRLILNAIVWTARAEVPAGGVDSARPEPK